MRVAEIPKTRAGRSSRSPGIALAMLTVLAWPAAAAGAEPDRVRFFERRIRPVLMSTCLECHGRDQTERGLRVDSLDRLLEGGESGPAVVPGEPDKSLLIQAVRREHDRFQMPPNAPLDGRAIADFEQWVVDGAVWPAELAATPEELSRQAFWADYWAFRPVERPEVPHGEGRGPRSPTDAFLDAALRERRLEPLPPADRRTLIRRASYGLTGLPPTPEEVAAFLEDEAPGAFERLVDRLLASPEYGRRWGRHWLDVARYADTSGDGTDQPVPEARLYRDYVIDAFNRDMPYDQFLIEQIAGDLLARREPEHRYEERVVATGFIALSRRFGNRHGSDHHLTIENTLDAIGEGLLGMTLSCARCHDHKFDPIPASDYYALYGFFDSTQYPHAGTEHNRYREHFPPRLPDAGLLEERHAELEEEQRQALAALEERIARLEERLDEAGRADADTRDLQRELSAARREQERADDDYARRLDRVRAALVAARARDGDAPTAWAVSDKPEGAGDARIHRAGNPRSRGDRVPRAYLSVLDETRPAIPEGESGRLELARWIASGGNPLTPRVMVNRIWQHHFGRGLVESVNLFGRQGTPPTHPELLDWLAAEFVESGWSVKQMHRRILASEAYQRSSHVAADVVRLQETSGDPDRISANSAARDAGRIDHPSHEKDPENRFLWRFPERRLEAEAIRDAVLFVSGRLDHGTPGGHPFPDEHWKQFTQHRPFSDVYDHDHRTVYLMSPRLNRHPFIELFDGPDPNHPTGRRDASTVPLQALFWMNSDFVRTNAQALARRLLEAEPDRIEARVRLAYELTLSRPPSADELEDALAYLPDYKSAHQSGDTAAWTSFARILFSSNEFLYIE